MDTTAKLKQFFFVLLILPAIALAQTTAGTEIANIQSWLNHEGQKYYKPGTGEQWVRNTSPNGDRYVKVETNIDYKASNGRNYPVVIEKTAQIDGTKIGKAMALLAKIVTPIALGLQVYSVVCELSGICKDEATDTWIKQGDPAYVGYPTTTQTTTHWRTNTIAITSAPTPQLSCSKAAPLYAPVELYYTLENGLHRCRNTSGSHNFLILENEGCPTNYTPNGQGGCTLSSSSQTRPATDQDWTDAETLLNDPRFDEPLLVNGQPVPLANLPILGNTPPITLSDSETINRDSNGNITGTTRTTTTLTLTDSATETRPGSVTGTETTTKTDYDTQGQPTGTQTSTSNPPPPEKPAEPPTISFDDVQDSEIEEEEIDFDLDEGESWGEGFCPPDETISYGYGTLTFDYQPACNFATNVRPVLLLIASITAMFIVSGIRVE